MDQRDYTVERSLPCTLPIQLQLLLPHKVMNLSKSYPTCQEPNVDPVHCQVSPKKKKEKAQLNTCLVGLVRCIYASLYFISHNPHWAFPQWLSYVLAER